MWGEYWKFFGQSFINSVSVLGVWLHVQVSSYSQPFQLFQVTTHSITVIPELPVRSNLVFCSSKDLQTKSSDIVGNHTGIIHVQSREIEDCQETVWWDFTEIHLSTAMSNFLRVWYVSTILIYFAQRKATLHKLLHLVILKAERKE